MMRMLRALLAGLRLAGPVLLFAVMCGCGGGRYMLDEPVNDPIMTVDDRQDDDLCNVEDAGVSGASGECPT